MQTVTAVSEVNARSASAVLGRVKTLPPPVEATPKERARFTLLEDLYPIQRKSYKKENRCLLPNPITIALKEAKDGEDLPPVLDGTVTVKLVDRDGRDLPPQKGHVLQSIEGGLVHALNKKKRARFSLKVLETSEGNLFRLMFSVSYRIKGGGNHEDIIFSDAFSVKSKKKKEPKDFP